MADRDIIVLGTSLGGVEALSRLVRHLPPGLSAALFVVCHFPAGVRSHLPEILSRSGPLLAVHAQDGEPIRLGQIYVAPPDNHMLLRPGSIELTHGARENRHRPAIDPLFRSAARVYGRRTIGVVLTGTQSDGSAGLLAIRASGGVAVVQDPEEALAPTMPQSAQDIAGADYVLPVKQIAALLVGLVQLPSPPEGGTNMADPLENMTDQVAKDMTLQQPGERRASVGPPGRRPAARWGRKSGVGAASRAAPAASSARLTGPTPPVPQMRTRKGTVMERTKVVPQGEAEDMLAHVVRLTLDGEACQCLPQQREQLAEALARLQEDLTELRKREQGLGQRVQELEEAALASHAEMLRYRELFEFAPDAYLTTDLAGNIRDANYAATALFRCPREFLIGKPLPFCIAAEGRPAFFRRLALLHSLRESFQAWEVRLQPNRAEPLDTSLTVTVTLDADGRPAGLRWLIRDISPRIRALEDLRAEKQFVDGLIDTAQVCVLVVSTQGQLLRTNAYVEAVTGHSKEHLLGWGWPARLFPPEEQEQVQEQFRQAATSSEGARGIHTLMTRDGGRRMVEWSARPLTSAAGAVVALLAVGHDITDLQEAQRQALQLERLAAIGQMATGLAHESRNALQRSQASLGMLRWRLEGQPAALDLVGRAQKAQEDLVRLYEDVRSYAAPITPEFRPSELAPIWRQAWEELTSLTVERQAVLEEDVGGLACTCLADPFRLKQVFRNIFENALAATPDPVRVRVTCREAQLEGRPALQIAVRDNGPGLNNEQKRHLFEPFYTTKVKGTGLGMAIAKRIVEKHGGRIAVGDPPAPGAEIVMLLPRRET